MINPEEMKTSPCPPNNMVQKVFNVWMYIHTGQWEVTKELSITLGSWKAEASAGGL